MSAAATDEIKVKGTVLKSSLAFVEERFGAKAVEEVRRDLPAETQAALPPIILTGGRYPLRCLAELCTAVDARFGAGDLALCWEIGKYSCDYEVNLLHRALMQVARIDYWFKIAASVWSFYYSAGKLSGEFKPDLGILKLAEFNPLSKGVCYRFGGWLHRNAELCGKSGVRLDHSECVLDGRPVCVWRGTWD